MQVTLYTEFDEENQTRPYRNGIAADLNQCLRAAYNIQHAGWSGCSESILRTVQRVAEFEDIRVSK